MDYRVTAGYVTVETAVPGGRASVDVGRGQLLPGDVPDEQRELLLAAGHIEPVDEQHADDPDDDGGDEGGDEGEVPDGTIAEVLAWVGGDRDRAARALEVERAKGGKARSTLVGDLEQLVDDGDQ